jgi:hypothetical protein
MDELIEKIRKRLAHASQGDRAYERPMTWDEADKLIAEIDRLRAALDLAETNVELADRSGGFGI